MTTLTFDEAELPPEIIETTNGTWSTQDGKLKLAGVDGSGNSEAVVVAAPHGLISFNVRTNTSSVPGNIGIQFRRTASDDWVSVLYSFQNKVLRILQKENGASTQTLATDTVGAGSPTAEIITIDISDQDVVSATIGSTTVSATTDYNNTVNGLAIRLDSVEMEVLEITYPTASGQVTTAKTLTFDVPADIQGKSDVLYWVVPATGGASLLNGTLDTSSATVDFDLTNVDGVVAGQTFYLWATDKPTATTSYAAWDDSDVVVTGG